MSSRISVIVLLIALLLNSCGGEMAADEAPLISTTTQPIAPNTTATGDTVTIGFAAYEYLRPTYEPLIDQFQAEHPAIRVQFISIDTLGGNGYYDLLKNVLSSADTSTLNIPDDAHSQQFVRDLTPLMDADAAFDRGDFFPGAIQPASNQAIYNLPVTIQVPLLVYNRELWAARGLQPPLPNWTWDDLLVALSQLAVKEGNDIQTYGLLDDHMSSLTLAHALRKAGVKLGSVPEQTRVDLPQIAAALREVAELAQSGAIYAPTQADDASNFQQYVTMIENSQIAMWPADRISTDPEHGPKLPDFPIGTATIPLTADEAPEFFVNGVTMSSGTQHPQEAWQWMSFLSRQRVVEPSNAFVGNVPARRSVVDSSGFWQSQDEEAVAAIQAVLGRPAPASAAPTGPNSQRGYYFYWHVNQALQAVLAGTNVEQALADAQNKYDQEMASIQAAPTPQPLAEPLVVRLPGQEDVPAGATVIKFDTLGAIPRPEEATQLAQTFMREHPDIYVDLSSHTNRPNGIAEVAEKADCFAYFSPPSAQEISATLDLQPLIDADATFSLDDYPTALLEPFRANNRLYGLPFSIQLRMLAYNKNAFDAAGISYPTAEWTIDNFRDAAQQLTSDTGVFGQRQYGFVSFNMIDELGFFLDRSGVSTTKGIGEAITPDYTNPTLVQTLQSYVDMLRRDTPNDKLRYYARSQNNETNIAPSQAIQNGDAGMWFDFGFNLLPSGVGQERGVEFAIAPPLLGNTQVTSNDFHARGLYISAKTPHVDACWTWMKFLTEQPIGYDGGFPARRSIATSDTFLRSTRPGAAEVYEAYSEALQSSKTPRPSSITYEREIDYYWFFRAIDRALQGGNLERELIDAQFTTEQFAACVRGGEQPPLCAKAVDPQYDGWQSGGE